METIISTNPELLNFYTQHRQNDKIPPAGNEILPVFLTIAQHILPETVKLSFELPQLEIQQKETNQVEITQFVNNFHTIKKMAKVVGLQNFTLLDCYELSSARWVEISRAINNYLKYKSYFRNLKQLASVLTSPEPKSISLETALQNKFELQAKADQTRSDLNVKQQRLVLDNIQPLRELDISGDVLPVCIESLSKARQEVEFQLYETHKHRQQLLNEKNNFLDEINIAKNELPKLQQRLNGLNQLHKFGISRTQQRFKTSEASLKLLKQKLDVINSTTQQTKTKLDSLKESTQMFELLNAKFDKLNSLTKNPLNLEKIRENIDILQLEFKNKKVEYTQLVSDLQNANAEIKNLRVELQTFKLKKSENEPVSLKNQRSLESINSKFKELKAEVDTLKREINVSKRYLLEIDSCASRFNLIIKRREQAVEMMKAYLGENTENRDPDIEDMNTFENSVNLGMFDHDRRVQEELRREVQSPKGSPLKHSPKGSKGSPLDSPKGSPLGSPKGSPIHSPLKGPKHSPSGSPNHNPSGSPLKGSPLGSPLKGSPLKHKGSPKGSPSKPPQTPQLLFHMKPNLAPSPKRRKLTNEIIGPDDSEDE